jgi:hypothetical protein
MGQATNVTADDKVPFRQHLDSLDKQVSRHHGL